MKVNQSRNTAPGEVRDGQTPSPDARAPQTVDAHSAVTFNVYSPPEYPRDIKG
jgi:hypothetical protein